MHMPLQPQLRCTCASSLSALGHERKRSMSWDAVVLAELASRAVGVRPKNSILAQRTCFEPQDQGCVARFQ